MVFCGSYGTMYLFPLSALFPAVLSFALFVSILLIVAQTDVFLWRTFAHDRNPLSVSCGNYCAEFPPWYLAKKMCRFIFLVQLGRCRSLSVAVFLWGVSILYACVSRKKSAIPFVYNHGVGGYFRDFKK